MSISRGQMMCNLALKQAETSEFDDSCDKNKNMFRPMHTQKNIQNKLMLLNTSAIIEEAQICLREQTNNVLDNDLDNHEKEADEVDIFRNQTEVADIEDVPHTVLVSCDSEGKITYNEEQYRPNILQDIDIHVSENGTSREEGLITDININENQFDDGKSLARIESDTENEPSSTNNENAAGKKSRKRQRNPSEWKRCVAKRKLNSGVMFTNSKGKLVPEKIPLSRCTDKKCSRDCAMITTEQQMEINRQFWKMGNITRQREFVVKNLVIVEPKYRYVRENSTRSKNLAYYFEIETKKIRGCKKMFLNTLNVSHKFLTTAWKKNTNVGIGQEDFRGKHGKQKKVSEEIRDGIRAHINSFSRVESHYCRARSQREYLDGNLNIATMYRMYEERCKENKELFGKQYLYENIFNNEFNLSFFQPKKGQCSICESFSNLDFQEKETMQSSYEIHINEKNLSREQKNKDIVSAKELPSMGVYCFDLQAVLNSPCGECSELYYKRKLSCYNFTLFDILSKEGHCYFWHEGIAKRGSNEIGSSIFKFLKLIDKENVIFYSDNCFGQNKNKYITSLFLFAVNHLEKLKSITHNFLVVGHTQNENDSVHATIEKEKKRVLKGGSITVPTQWVTVLKSAKKTGKPYRVTELDTTDILDLKALAQGIGNNFNISETGDKVPWGDIKVIQVRKSDPYKIYFKRSYKEEHFQCINISRTKRRGRPSVDQLTLVKAYSSPPKIDVAKKKDLMSLCENNIIPRVHWEFYKNLHDKGSTNNDDLISDDSDA